MKNNATVFFLLIVLLVVTACDKEAGDIPAYMQVPSVSLSTDLGQGSTSHRITDLWINLGDEFHGTYVVGSDIPVLENGRTPVSIFPGVKMNGSIGFPTIYNMYAPYRDTIDFSPMEKEIFDIEFKYKENAFFALQEDFEQPHRLNVDLDEFDTTRIVRTRDDVKWGAFAGEITLTKEFPRFKVGSDLIFNDLNVPNRRVFLELDYKSDETFFIGFRGNRNGLSPDNLLDAVITPKDDWNKIYFDFSNFVNGTNWDYYQLLIEGSWTQEDTNAVSKIYLDNIKLTYLLP